eukprot:CAMPEP_0177618280 /NCGR_PEP_ID=MMETSP0419_2-20121207/25469_1 /TAXON_ID=582737 /ORGANISM="Tetraselmis sp., Strain GSL018" /LENGTH=652 /DNA_ID=CAMNT_0019117123 /DNA_START=217 /DNA_END=2175 /DNA_ORIENTATION=+
MFNLFQNLSITLTAEERVALIGPNGCGKSSLLRILGGADEPTSGHISRKRNLKVGFLEQQPDLPEEHEALQALLSMENEASKALLEYETALSAVERGERGAKAVLDRCTDTMDAIGAWELRSEAEEVLRSLGICDTSMRVADMSGGQRRRVALASAVLSEPGLILLDEPTNHMDLDVIRWMEGWLGRSSASVVMVTHDRRFMEAVCSRVLELDRDGSSHVHRFGGAGSYARVQEARSQRRAAQAAAARDAKTMLRRESAWMARQPKARSTKSRARVAAFHELSRAARAGPSQDPSLGFGSGRMERQGKRVIELKGCGYTWKGLPLFDSIDYVFEPGDKVGVVGANGSGKSTLLDILAGRLQPTQGSVEVGETTRIGYFTQHLPVVREDLRVVDYLREVYESAEHGRPGPAEGPTGASLMVTLDQVGFPRRRHYDAVGLLSGGERRRLHLASILVREPNVLILDEPTNDLDLETVEVLEEMLSCFPGVVVTVSHDHQFMDNNADRLFVFQGNGVVKLFDGCYSEYLQAAEAESPATPTGPKTRGSRGRTQKSEDQGQPGRGEGATPAPRPSGGGASAEKRLRLGYRERIELEELEPEIEGLEARRERIMQDMNRSGVGFEALQELSVELASLEQVLERKTERWLQLADRADVE